MDCLPGDAPVGAYLAANNANNANMSIGPNTDWCYWKQMTAFAYLAPFAAKAAPTNIENSASLRLCG